MTETTEACIRGCSIYREHLAECEGFNDPGRVCEGCLPRRAFRGHLCGTCYRRFELMLTDAPTVHRWLTGNLGAGDQASRMKQDYERRGGGEKGVVETPVPLKVEMLDVRDLLADRLAIWVDHWCEVKGLSGPLRHGVKEDSGTLLRWLPGIAALDWIGDWWEELAECMIDAHALAPWRPPVRRIKGIPCPGCAETNLVIYGGESDITCQSCKILITEERFGIWERVLKAEGVAS